MGRPKCSWEELGRHKRQEGCLEEVASRLNSEG